MGKQSVGTMSKPQRSTPQTIRLCYALALVVTIPLGLWTKIYNGPGEGWVQGSAGDILFEMAWIFFIMILNPRLVPLRVGLWVFGVTSGVEVLQLWQPAWLQAIRATLPGKLLLGSTFHSWDFLYYALGCGLGIFIVVWIQRGGQHAPLD